MKGFDYTIGMYGVVKKYAHKSDAFCIRERLHKMIELELGAEIDWERIDQQKELALCKTTSHRAGH